jgi:predicted nucleic acid-binding protein
MARKVAPASTENAARLVIADASPIIGLSLIGGLTWLKPLFGGITITKQVRDELLHNFAAAPKAGMAAIAAAIEDGIIALLPRDCSSPLFNYLDDGEASVLRAAANQRGKCLVIIDETLGRRAASDLGIAVTGLVGIIIAAKKKQLIPTIAPLLAQLDAAGFRLSAGLVAEALAIVGEGA